jgi:hypothetical protein
LYTEWLINNDMAWSRKVQDQDIARFGVWCAPACWFIDGPSVSSQCGRGQEALGVSFIMALIPFMRALLLSPPNTIASGVNFQHLNPKEDTTFRSQQTLAIRTKYFYSAF